MPLFGPASWEKYRHIACSHSTRFIMSPFIGASPAGEGESVAQQPNREEVVRDLQATRHNSLYAQSGISGMIRPTKHCKTSDSETTVYLKDVSEGASPDVSSIREMIAQVQARTRTIRERSGLEYTAFSTVGFPWVCWQRHGRSGSARHRGNHNLHKAIMRDNNSAQDTKPFFETGGDKQP